MFGFVANLAIASIVLASALLIGNWRTFRPKIEYGARHRLDVRAPRQLGFKASHRFAG
jgi:hypothetical protein